MSPDLESSHHISRVTWVAAAFIALAMHVGCIAWASTLLQDNDSDPELGTAAIEIGIERLAPHLVATDLAPGPNAEESAPSPAMVEQAQLTEPTTLPQGTPTETDDPSSIVAPTEADKPKQDEVPTPVAPANPSIAAIAAQATAVPTSELIKEATRSVAPEQGTGTTAQRIRATWQKELVAHFDRHKRYPVTSSDESGEVVVKLTIDDGGHIVSSSIVRGSGYEMFDEAALSMIQRSDPVPRPPTVVAQQGLTFTLPVFFRARH
jgi:periplasmic protein TonB